MSLTTELIGRLRKEADGYMGYRSKRAIRVKHLLREAADTIKVQSAKIHAYAMERSTAYYNGGWIPVSERLPEEACGCVVTVEEDDRYGEPQRVIYPDFVGYDGETWNDADGNICPFEVIAWMPLPEPYREDGE